MTAFMDRLLIKNLVFVNPFVKKFHFLNGRGWGGQVILKILTKKLISI
jgi:hypothetical protein